MEPNNGGGMPPVGTFTVALIEAEHGKGIPTAIIYAQSERVDATRALRDFCTAYGSAKGAVAIVTAFGPEVFSASAVTESLERSAAAAAQRHRELQAISDPTRGEKPEMFVPKWPETEAEAKAKADGE